MKRTLSLVLASSLLVAATAGCAQNGINPTGAHQAEQGGMLVAGKPTGKLIVKLRPGQTLRLKQGFGGKAQSEIPSLNMYSFELPAGKSVSDLKKELGASVEYIEQDLVVTMADPIETLVGSNDVHTKDGKSAFNDPESANQWGIVNTQQAEAIAAVKGGNAETVLAIVDTGVDLTHPDLKDKIVKGYNATGVSGLFGMGSAKDDNGHGTHCAGIAAAITNNGVGIAGMAPNVKIMPVRVLAGPGSGSLMSVAKGIVWAADHGADVISLSLGGAGTMQSLGDAVAHALKKNAVVVAAMGNAGHAGNPISYPAAYPGTIGVGATDDQDKIAVFSSFNTYTTVSAPGVKIFATTPTYDVWLTKNSKGAITKNYSYMSGTSMATPLVAGLCALIRSKHKGLSPAKVKEILERSADKVPAMEGETWTEKFGHGRINALKAVSL